ncbi:MipA/OmpV family protein [Trinickia diaoshuihuensis]|jgi:outer membrane scaffolding protein for murein synthesis (MipA/OmpV family)|uniref:MipA/OmpV family protein n=1 Tax=Trinickia diaoshuihuensis TaxID=2292265 RepID=UPI000E221811|nr:MipA/OmpV family protein [Trinickia diaoshuihuensis]
MSTSFAASRLALAGALFAVLAPAHAQTPSPLAEWQYSPGILLEQMFEPKLPTWRIRVGPSAAFQPLYDGSDRYHALAGPSIDIRYRDRFFLSTGEGIGMNVLTGPNWRVGIGAAYNLGRREADDLGHLHGMGNINPAPSLRLLGEYALSKSFPLVLRADVRRSFGGDNGWIGDLGAYMPMPGSSETFAWFAGPTMTIADSRYMNSWFGVNAGQSARTGYRQYDASPGIRSVGFGVSASLTIRKHWIVSADGAFQQLVGSAAHSPITQTRASGVFDLSVNYEF